MKPLDGPSGPEQRFHRPARLGRGLPARRRLDRPRPDLGPARRRGPHPAGLRRRSARAPRRSPARSRGPRTRPGDDDRVRARLRIPHGGDADPRRPRASPSPTPRSSGRRSTRSATGSTSGSQAGDVRLTMGGEPTFVSIDDMDGAEWNIDRRSGPTSAAWPASCCGGSRDRFAPGRPAALRPGQVVSRRVAAALGASAATGARDGVADLGRPGADRRRGARLRPRRRRRPSAFVDAPGRAAGRRPDALPCPATRTSGTTSGTSAGCRSTSIRCEASSTTPRSARGWRRSSSRGWTTSSATPCRCGRMRRRHEPRWAERPVVPAPRAPVPASRATRRWATACRSTRCPGRRPGTRDAVHRARPVRPARTARRREAPSAAAASPAPPAVDGPATAARHDGIARASPLGESAAGVVRTALCVEPRDGRLHVFMPPQRVPRGLPRAGRRRRGDRAASSALPVMIEGYPPPHDHRLNHFSVTPDPGVIEVNIHPAHDWDELVEHTTTLYEEARQTRLGTEKFMLDGRHTGTGGGNHIVLGGPTAGRQPVPAPARPAAQPASATGTTIRRCRTCSPACSSARRARRRASTRRGTTASTSWRSPSARSPTTAAARPGWSTASSAICWST